MPGSPTLRNAGPNDRHFAYEVKRAAMREYVERVWGWDEDQQRQLHDRGFREQDVQVITLDGEDVGILSVAEKTRRRVSQPALRLAGASGSGHRPEVHADGYGKSEQSGHCR